MISSPLHRALGTATRLFQSTLAQEPERKVVLWPELISSRGLAGGEGEDIVDLERRYGPDILDSSRLNQGQLTEDSKERAQAVKDYLLHKRNLKSNAPFEVAVVTHSVVIPDLIPSKS